ncbi:MAG: alpha/beta hydrolase, partial [Sandaracinaceae bacterium]|nr:alpha/beta hydrolase [Sandaracinaceae bacterium]
GEPVLLVMGFGSGKELWQPQIDDLSRDHRIIAVDNRGIGDSELGKEPLTMRVFARDLLRLIDELKEEKVHLVGVSMGGMIAQEFAIQYPSRLRSLTLIATHPGAVHVFPKPMGLYYFSKAFRGSPSSRLKAMRAMLYPKEYVDEVGKEALAERMRQMMGSPAPMETVRAHFLAILRHRTVHRLHQISAPTLIIRPIKDILVNPAASLTLHRKIRGSKLLEIPGSGHGLLFQSADEVNAALRAHFKAHSD